MIRFPRSIWCKTAAVVLVGLLALQSDFMLAQGTDAMAERFAAAKASYAAGDFEGARAVLETMLPELEETAGRDTLKGEAYLFLGAALEKLQEKELAVANYCRAKALLGEGQGCEGLVLEELTYYGEPCPPALAPVAVVAVEEDALVVRFGEARTFFFAGEYAAAKAILEKLVAELAAVEGRDSFKGEVYLLSGAAYEKLKYKELAIKYFCLAKDVLGAGKTIEGLKLKDYKYYKSECRAAAVVAKAGRKRGGFGKFLGALLGLAALAVGGYFLYTKVIKKEEKEEDKDVYYETDYQAWNCWLASANSSSATLPTISPANTWAPTPTFANGYDSTATVSITGPQIVSWSIKLSITACKGLTRRDIVYVNDAQVLDVTNRFDRACGGDINSFCNNPTDGKSYDIASGSGEVSLKLRHQIVFTLPSGVAVRVVSNASFLGE
jgi:tetratricopeptide (TPR) repeat protein